MKELQLLVNINTLRGFFAQKCNKVNAGSGSHLSGQMSHLRKYWMDIDEILQYVFTLNVVFNFDSYRSNITPTFH